MQTVGRTRDSGSWRGTFGSCEELVQPVCSALQSARFSEQEGQLLYCPSCATQCDAGAEACPKCGRPLPRPPLAQSTTPADAELKSPSRAPVGRRVLAVAIDAGWCLGLSLLLSRYLVTMVGAARLRRPMVSMLVLGLIVLAPLLYGLLKDSLGGKSIGKLLSGLTAVRHPSKRRVGVPESILRNLPFGLVALALGIQGMVPHAPIWIRGPLLVASLAILGVPATWCAVQILVLHKSRHLGDRWAGTLVVADRDLEAV